MHSTLDRCLIYVFYIFAFTALVFEPLYYFGCAWNFHTCLYEDSSFLIRLCKDMWGMYCKWDPLFYAPPDWLKIMCYVEVLVFGPLYALSAYGLQCRCRWLPHVTLPFVGALFYSTVIYFMMEFVYTEPGTDLMMVLVVNIPWSIFPVLLGYRVIQLDNERREGGHKAL